MDMAAFRETFAAFLGSDGYKAFVDRLSMDERLDCWQERSWREFVAAHPEFSCTADELPQVLNSRKRAGRTPPPNGSCSWDEASMTEEQWLRSEDVPAMLRWFRANWRGTESDLNQLIQRYCLACCRRIWPLLILEDSRRGVEIAERYNEGLATGEELSVAEWKAEGAAFYVEQNAEAEPVLRGAESVASMPPEVLRMMVRPKQSGEPLTPIETLTRAAYFADFAICYTRIRPKESIDRYAMFLSAPLLREIVGNPFRSE
jgi:hypothetical protein